MKTLLVRPAFCSGMYTVNSMNRGPRLGMALRGKSGNYTA